MGAVPLIAAARVASAGASARSATRAPSRCARGVQRTALNTEAKLLLLAHAVDGLGCVAVEFRTHALNQASRRAIERLGAKPDGLLRGYRRAKDGTLGDTAVYRAYQVELISRRGTARSMFMRVVMPTGMPSDPAKAVNGSMEPAICPANSRFA